MKLKDGFLTYNDGDDSIIVGTDKVHFNGIARFNSSAAYMVELLKSETTEEEIVDSMLEKYDVPKERLAADVKRVLEALRSIGAIDE